MSLCDILSRCVVLCHECVVIVSQEVRLHMVVSKVCGAVQMFRNYEGVRSNVIGVTRRYGVSNLQKRLYVTLE